MEGIRKQRAGGEVVCESAGKGASGGGGLRLEGIPLPPCARREGGGGTLALTRVRRAFFELFIKAYERSTETHETRMKQRIANIK